MQQEVLDIRKRVLHPDDPLIATSIGNIAASHSGIGENQEAVSMFAEALEIHKRVLPPDDPRIATSMENLAKTFGDLGRHEEALKIQKRST